MRKAVGLFTAFLACALPTSQASADYRSWLGVEPENFSSHTYTYRRNNPISLTAPGLFSRAMTDAGINKIAVFADGTQSSPFIDNFATSIWTSRVTHTGDTNTTFTSSHSVDGTTNILSTSSPVSSSFSVAALRGVWLNADDDNMDDPTLVQFGSFYGNTQGIWRFGLDDDDGMTAYFEGYTVSGIVNTVFGSTSRQGEVLIERIFTPGVEREIFFTPELTRSYVNGVLTTYVGDEALLRYQQAEGRNRVLGYQSVCLAECLSGSFERTLDLSFNLRPSDVFTLASSLTIEGLTAGTFDAFNTARFLGAHVTSGSLSSMDGLLQLREDGSYGFATVDAIPEPTTWAMMIAGMGLAGAALRRRRTHASFAYAAPR